LSRVEDPETNSPTATIAHEMQHAKTDAAWEDIPSSLQVQLQDVLYGDDDFEDEEIEEMFEYNPQAALFLAAFRDPAAFAKEAKGISDYADGWWRDALEEPDFPNVYDAISETISEIAGLEAAGRKPKLGPLIDEFYEVCSQYPLDHLGHLS
jgi:hypothetical protein